MFQHRAAQHGPHTVFRTIFACKHGILCVPSAVHRPLEALGMFSTTLTSKPKASNVVFPQVQPMGSAQRCQLHRRLISLSLAGVGPGGGSGAGGNGGCAGRGGVGTVDSWDWEDAWERMPPNLRVSLLVAVGCVLISESLVGPARVAKSARSPKCRAWYLLGCGCYGGKRVSPWRDAPYRSGFCVLAFACVQLNRCQNTSLLLASRIKG